MGRRQKLIDIRNNKNWSQKDVVGLLALRFDIPITESYYGMIEQGTRTPKLGVGLAIAKLFQASPYDIFFNESPYKKLFYDQIEPKRIGEEFAGR